MRCTMGPQVALGLCFPLAGCVDVVLDPGEKAADVDVDTGDSGFYVYEHAYTAFSGTEAYEYGGFHTEAGQRHCELAWTTSGTPVTPMACELCEFVFDVQIELDADNSTDDGECASMLADFSFTYGYTSDYYGYGAYLLVGYYGYYYAWAPARLRDTSFTYASGYRDYYYLNYYGYYEEYAENGYYLTSYWSGAATVE